jgi:hypothetical protein
MSTNANHDQEEIELGQLFGKIGNIFDSMLTTVFKGILFIQKNIILLVTFLIVGAGLGNYLDTLTKVYNHEVIVTPNFSSVDYLYNKINLINSKIRQNDTAFLKSIGIKQPEKFKKISIKPIVDVYSFVNESWGSTNNAQNTQNFELVKLLSEDGDINKVIKDSLTSRNYGQHKIIITTDGITSNNQTIDPLIVFLNESSFYKEYQTMYRDNLNSKLKQYGIMMNQIDTLLNKFSNTYNSQRSDKLIYYNENTQLNGIIEQKNSFINRIVDIKTQLITTDKVIKDKSRVINIENTKGINNKMKLLLPIVFIFGFIFLRLFVSFYKKQKFLQNKLNL